MATVPRLTSLSVAPAAAPNIQLQNANTAELTTIGARQTQQTGQALGAAGGALEQIRYQELEEANALRTADALNQYQEEKIRLKHDPNEGYTNLKGFDALNREGGRPLAEEYTAKLDTVEARIASTLGNDRQRQMFQTRVKTFRTQFLDDAMQYEGQQQQTYSVGVRDTGVRTSANSLVLEASNPERNAMHQAEIRASILGAVDPDTGVFIKGTTQLLGQSAAWGEQKAAEAISAAHTAAVTKFMGMGDLNAAMAYRKRYGKSLTAADMITIDGTLEKSYETARGAAAARDALQSFEPAINPTGMDRVRAVRDRLESGGRGDFGPDGALLQGPVTSSGERAVGSAQVMPSTYKNPGYGIKPADLSGSPQQQAAEIKRVGDQKLDVLIKMFDGDLAATMGAYNWGEKNVRDAQKKAVQAAGAGEVVPRDAWLAYAPKETRKYVEDFGRALADPVASMPARPTAEQVVQRAREKLGQNISPWAAKAATETAVQDFELRTKAVQQRKDETLAAGYYAVQKADGRWSAVDPQMRARIEREAPEKLDELRSFGSRIARGDDITDDRLYLRLMTNPKETLGKMSDAEFYQLHAGLSKADFQMFTKMRADLSSGKTGDAAGDLNTDAIGRTLNNRMSSIGIDPKPQEGSNAAQRVGAIRRFIDASVLDAQRGAGKKFTDAEVQQHIDGLFAKSVELRSSFLGFDTTKSRQLLSMKVSDIPGDQADRIRKAFKAQGNGSPSDGDVLGAYIAGMAAPKPQTPKTGAF